MDSIDWELRKQKAEFASLQKEHLDLKSMNTQSLKDFQLERASFDRELSEKCKIIEQLRSEIQTLQEESTKQIQNLHSKVDHYESALD